MIVFFDVDGVLNKRFQWVRSYQLDATCVRELCRLVNDLGASLVIASSWRTGFLRSESERNYSHVKSLEKLLGERGIKIAGKTPVIGSGKRDEEITAYLKTHSDRYIVIDDDPQEYSKVDEHIYFTDANAGFTKADYKKVMALAKKLL